MDNLFLYGEFNNEKFFQKCIGRIPVGEKATLNGYRLIDDLITDSGGYSEIEEASEFSVEGFLYSVFPEELSLFDQCTFDNYKRERVLLDSGISAFTYTKKHKD